MKKLISGRAAFVELKEEMDKQSRPTPDTDDVFVILEPDNIPIFEVRYTETSIVFLRNTSDPGKLVAIPISHGNPFTVSIIFLPRKGAVRRVTQFTDHG